MLDLWNFKYVIDKKWWVWKLDLENFEYVMNKKWWIWKLRFYASNEHILSTQEYRSNYDSLKESCAGKRQE